MKRQAYFFIVISAILWGTLGFFSKKLTSFGFNAIQIVSIRAFGGALVLAIFLIFKNRELLKIKISDSFYFIGTGILSFAFFNICYFEAINKTSISVAAILLYTSPTFVMIFSSILFKENITKKKMFSILLTFIGCIFVSGIFRNSSENFSLLGILLGLGSGFGYALYSIFARYAIKKYAPITITLYTFIFASIFLIPIANIKKIFVLLTSTNSIYYAVALVLLATIVPFILYTKGLSYIETSKAAIIATVEPVVAMIIGITIFNEPITVLKTIGIIMVILATVILREKF